MSVLGRDGDDWVELGSMLASGQIFVNIPDGCRTDVGSQTCNAVLTRLQLDSLGTLTIGEETVSNVHLVNEPPANETFSIDQGEGAMAVNPPLRFGLTGDLASASYQFASLEPSAPVTTGWDWGSRSVLFSTILDSEDGALRVVVQGYGAFDSLPPTVTATASPSVLECGERLVLNAVGADPDGASDITAVSWTSQWNAHVWQAEGAHVVVNPPLGPRRFYATIHDATGITDSTHVDVVVEDTMPPTLDVPAELKIEACAPRTVSLVPRGVEDTCDIEPATDIRITAINGVPVSIPYTAGTVFRMGETTVRYRAVDDAGNEAIGMQTVVLEKGATCCPAGALVVNGTNQNDTLFGSDVQPACLVGLDGVDNLVGKTRFETFLGGRGNDQLQNVDKIAGNVLWGGIGNDALRSSGPGDLLFGGAGDDTLIYSGVGSVKLRGGAGKDTITSNAGVQLATFVVGAPCELRPGEKWTSNGPTRVESPISIAQIQAQGVTLQLTAPVQFVQTGVLADAECQ